MRFKKRTYKAKPDKFTVYIGNIIKIEKVENKINIKTSNASIKITVIQDDLLRIRITNAETFRDLDLLPVIAENHEKISIEIKEEKEYYEFQTKSMKVIMMKSPLRFLIYDLENNLLSMDDFSYGICWDDKQIGNYKRLQKNECIIGLGEHSGNLDRKYQEFINYNFPRYREPFYCSIPFYISIVNKRACGIFLNNPARTFFNFGKSLKNKTFFGTDGNELNYYFIYGPSVKKILKIYTDLTGRGELPPHWALGYHQSKFSYKSDSGVRKITERLRIKQIPCDSIFLDLHYMKRYRNFTWNSKKFPNPKRLINNLKKMGFHTTVIIDPWLKKDKDYEPFSDGLKKDYLCKTEKGKLYTGFNLFTKWVTMPDFFKEDVRDWWASLHSKLFDLGIDGIWNDKNEPELMNMAEKHVIHGEKKIPHEKVHNIFPLYELEATKKAFKKYLPNQRPFILTRSGFPGVQCYAAMWTGDIRSRFKDMAETVPMLANMSISGIPFCGADVGGFWSVKKLLIKKKELFIRWIQLGVFYPFFRNHNALFMRSQEPWCFGKENGKIITKYIKLRYRLFPYIYNAFYEWVTEAKPIFRPLIYDFQNDPNCCKINHEFLFGNDLLIAPVTMKKVKDWAVYLPRGRWIDYWTKEEFVGGKVISIEVPIEMIPIFVKKGAIIPSQADMQYIGEKRVDPLILDVYPHKKSTINYYEDDGITFNYKNGEYSLTKIECESIEDKINFYIHPREGDFDPGDRHIILKINKVEKKPKVIKVNGLEIQEIDKVTKIREIASFNRWGISKTKNLYLRFIHKNEFDKIEILF
ncbi:MAG: TIM-barrel domain-containing protein [Candidatus Helarchaeota archaeon]